MAESTFYLQLVPEFYGSGPPRIRKLLAERITRKRPEQPIGGGVTVKLTVRIADEVFLPLQPAAVIEIGAEHITVTPTVEVSSDPVGA